MKTIKISFFTVCLCFVFLFFICACSNVFPEEQNELDLNEVIDLHEESSDKDTEINVEVQPVKPSTEEPTEPKDVQPEEFVPVEPPAEEPTEPKDVQPEEVVSVEPSTEEPTKPNDTQPEEFVPVEPPAEEPTEPKDVQPEDVVSVEPPMVDPVGHPRENPPETDPDDIVIATPTYYELPEGPRVIESEIPFPMTLDMEILNPHSYEKLTLTWGNNMGYFSPHGQYWIEKLTDGEWCEVQPIEEIPLPAKPGFGPAPRIETIDLGKYYPGLTDGRYRVVKFIDGKFYAVEFVMDEKAP